MRSCLLFILILFLLSVTSNAQNYQPFSKNSYVYNFAGTDEFYKLSIDSVAANTNGDSVFYFNPIAHTDPNVSVFAEFKINHNNIFGRSIIKKLNGDFYFLAFNDSLLVKTLVDTNSKWIFSKSQNITATLKNKTIENVFGTQDSVITIALSTGDILEISKNFGLIKGKIFIRQPFININYDPVESIPDTTLILASIPTINKGLDYPDFADFFNYEPGDVFGYESKSPDWIITARYEDYELNKFFSRKTSNNRDTVILIYEHKYYFKSTRFNTNQPEPDIYITIHNRIDTSIIEKTNFLFLEANSLNFGEEKFKSGFVDFLSSIKYDNTKQHFKLEYRSLSVDINDSTLVEVADAGGSQIFTQRLGRTEFYGNGYDNLVCYSINNGTENWGKCPDLDKLLSVEENPAFQPVFQISPNPATNEITIKASSKNNNQNGNNLIKITDIQGKIVYQQIINSATVNQNEEVKVDVSALQNGLYLLHFISETGSISSQKFIISK